MADVTPTTDESRLRRELADLARQSTARSDAGQAARGRGWTRDDLHDRVVV